MINFINLLFRKPAHEAPIARKGVLEGFLSGFAIGDAVGLPVCTKTRNQLHRTPITELLGYGIFAVPAGTTSSLSDSILYATRFYKKNLIINSSNTHSIVNPLSGYTPNPSQQSTAEYLQHLTTEEATTTMCAIELLALSLHVHPLTINMRRELFFGHAKQLNLTKPKALATYFVFELLINIIYKADKPNAIKNARKALLNASETYNANDLSKSDINPLLKLKLETLTIGDTLPPCETYIECIQSAVWAFLSHKNFNDCVLSAANQGGNTLLTTSIAGALAGVFYGYSNIPKEWWNSIQIKAEIAEILNT